MGLFNSTAIYWQEVDYFGNITKEHFGSGETKYKHNFSGDIQLTLTKKSAQKVGHVDLQFMHKDPQHQPQYRLR